MQIEWVPTNSLVPNPKNRNKHPKEQIERLAKIIKANGWRHPIIVSKLSGQVVVGHGRLEAAKLLSEPKVPVHFQDFANETEEYQFGIADNAIASWAELDLSGINADLPAFGPELDVDLLGIKDFELEPADKYAENNYSRNIEAPIYKPRGTKPNLGEVYDKSKTEKLQEKILSSKLPDNEKEFLIAASNRHTVFNYEKIADYYANSEKSVQELMEDSALVIIDFNKAIEQGFIDLTSGIIQEYGNQK